MHVEEASLVLTQTLLFMVGLSSIVDLVYCLLYAEVTAIAASTPDVRQLLLGSESVSQLTASLPGQATHTGGERMH